VQSGGFVSKQTDPFVARNEMKVFKQMLHQFLDQGLSLSSAVQKINAHYQHHTPKENTICLGITEVLQERGVQNTFASFAGESGMIEIVERIPWTSKRSPDPER
jgi:hypothetical protein